MSNPPSTSPTHTRDPGPNPEARHPKSTPIDDTPSPPPTALGAALITLWSLLATGLKSSRAEEKDTQGWNWKWKSTLASTVGIGGFVLACVALWATITATNDGHKSAAFAEWTALKEFLEYCQMVDYEPTACESARNMSLSPPPTFEKRGRNQQGYGEPNSDASSLCLPIILLGCCLLVGCRRQIIRWSRPLRRKWMRTYPRIDGQHWYGQTRLNKTPFVSRQAPGSLLDSNRASATGADLSMERAAPPPRRRMKQGALMRYERDDRVAPRRRKRSTTTFSARHSADTHDSKISHVMGISDESDSETEDMRTEHGSSDMPKDGSSGTTTALGAFRCNICWRRFNRKALLRVHRQAHE